MFKTLLGFFKSSSKRVKEVSHKGRKNQPTYMELSKHKCSCGKLLEDHDVKGAGSGYWATLKMYYDLGTCEIGDRTVNSKPNGWDKFYTYYYMNQKDADIIKNSTDFYERRRALERNYN